MYNFIDTIEHQSSGSLAAEAITINGVCLDTTIEGFRTLTVQGRELLSTDIESTKIGVSDGTRFKYGTKPERIITVQYQLIAETNSDFRAAFEQLNRYLNVHQVRIEFADDDGKYYIGTPGQMDVVEPGHNAVIGQFEIVCNDPFKYKDAEQTFTLTNGSSTSTGTINYQGSYPSYPEIEVEFYHDGSTGYRAGDCGWLGIHNYRTYQGFDADTRLEFGKYSQPDYTDEGTINTVLDRTFANYDNTQLNGFRTTRSIWSPDWTLAGSYGVSASSLSQSYGSGTGWHGPSVEYQTGMQVTGLWEVTAGLKYNMNYAKSNHKGIALIAAKDVLDRILAGIYFEASGETTVTAHFIIEDVDRYQRVFNSDEANHTIRISKYDGGVSFHLNPLNFSISFTTEWTISPVITTIANMTYGSDGTIPMGFKSLLFTYRTTGSHVNTFRSGQRLKVNTELAETNRPGTVDLLSNWTNFFLAPGENRFTVYYSSWIHHLPTVTIKYKEKYL